VRDLQAALDLLERASGPPDPVPAASGWELVLAENVGYLVDDAQRRRALDRLRATVGLAPEQILAAPEEALREIVVGIRPADRVERLRRCAELAIAGAPWRAFPGIGAPGVERIELFSGTRAVLALDANALRVLTRLGYGDAQRSYAASYRQAQSDARPELPPSVPAMQRATQLLRRHGQTTCRRTNPACATCAIAAHCPSAGRATTLY
jgi:adenine-specific DNA glycosylase